MLKLILNDTHLNSKDKFNIILLPPFSSTIKKETHSFDYLASHVIPMPIDMNSSQINLRLKYRNIVIDKNENVFLSYNDHIYKTNHDQIITDNKRINILRSELLYLYPNNISCSHLVLYLDQPLVEKNQVQNLNELGFKDLIQKILPTSDNTLYRIDELATELCNNLIHCTDVLDVSRYMEAMLEEAYYMIDGIDKPSTLTCDYLHETLDNYIMDLTYDTVFFKITQLKLQEDKQLDFYLKTLRVLDFSQIDLPECIKNGRERVGLAITEFEKIGSFRTPVEKLNCLVNTLVKLTNDPSGKPQTHSAFLDSDSLIPLLLMTIIKSKVPHLTANLIYMRDYTFSFKYQNGKYGYSRITFESVLSYVWLKYSELSKIAHQNLSFWSAIQNEEFESVSHQDLCDPNGHTPLMLACLYRKPKMVQYFLDMPLNQQNIQGCTALMCAIIHPSLEIVQLLLSAGPDLSITDHLGQNALCYAIRGNDLPILTHLIQHGADPYAINPITHESCLHLVRSSPIMTYLLEQVPELKGHRNSHGQTLYHVCQDVEVLKLLLPDPLLFERDGRGQTAWMVWAAQGRLDLLELVLPYLDGAVQFVNHQGCSVLHLLAIRSDWRLGQNSLDFIVEHFRSVIDSRDWIHGNTPLHLAVQGYQKSNRLELIRVLCKYGAMLHVLNDRNQYPMDLCYKSPDIIAALEEVGLNSEPSCYPIIKDSPYQYSWSIVRTWIDQHSKVYFIIKSGQMGKPESIRIVRRTLQEFILLRKEILYELPELFLPTLDIPFAMYQLPVVLEALQSFMEALQDHPTLRHHDLVLSFVRSTAELQHTVIHDYSFSRRRLMLEKLNHPVLNKTNTEDELYFLNYIEHEVILPLKRRLKCTIILIRKLMQSGKELENEMNMVSQQWVVKPSYKFTPAIVKTMHACANITFSKSFISPWLPFLRTLIYNYSMMDGILLALQRPYTLIKQRETLRDTIENQKEVLITTYWQNLFVDSTRKEGEKDKVEDINELNYLDSQIDQSHKMISDELAHFQTTHPKQMIKSIRQFVKLTLASEKHKLDILHQTLNDWDKPLPPTPKPIK